MTVTNDHKSRITDYFGFTAPLDFFLFWEFARSRRPEDPALAFYDQTGIVLTGPFDVLAGRFDNQTPSYDPSLHWRYFGDPPEFVTILTGGSDGLHWGYIVSNSGEEPSGIAGYYAYDDPSLFEESTSLFGLLQDHLGSMLEDVGVDLRHGMDSYDEDYQSDLQQCLEEVKAYCLKENVVVREAVDLKFVKQCNDPPRYFKIPKPKAFKKIANLVDSAIRKSTAHGINETELRLHLGRFLWHWHTDGNPGIEEVAFSLLDAAYSDLGESFLRNVLQQHREHRHRPSLDVFDD